MRWNAESNARYYTQIRYSVQLVLRYSVQLVRDCTAPQMAREYEQASRRLPVVPNDFAYEVRYDLVDSGRAGSGGA
jgi:propanediol dehydratase small subunit